MLLFSIMRLTKNSALLTPAAQVTLLAQKPNPLGSLFTRRARSHALPGSTELAANSMPLLSWCFLLP